MAEMDCGLDEDLVVLVLTDPLSSQDEELTQRGTSISVSDIHDWNLSLILSSSIIKVEANRSRLMQQSSYFRGLLGGSFSESSLHHVVVQWNLEVIVTVLQFMYGVSINVTPHSLLPLLEGALFFGVESLLLECENWYRKFTSEAGNYTPQMPLDALIEMWNFGSDHGIGFVQEMCKDYLARNFVAGQPKMHLLQAWTMSNSSFAEIPYALLYSCIGDSHLTVESEMQLCEAILNWLSINSSLSDCLYVDCGTDYCHILKKVRICLLPLWFAAGKRRHFFKFADKCVSAIIYLIENYPTSLLHAVPDGVLDNHRIRLTKYSKKVVLSGCPQITVAFLILAALPLGIDDKLKTRIINSLIEIDYWRGDGQPFDKSLQIVPFESVHELDISKCPKIQFGAAVRWLPLVFPSLRILKASYSMDFEMDNLFYLVRNCCHINEVDLTVDISPVIPMKVSILSACTEEYGLPKHTRYKLLKEDFVTLEKSLSSITKLSLEGRNDINDSDLLNISSLFGSLCYLNIKGCTLVTDIGISKLLCKCLNIKSVILSYTSFGRNSVLTLCSDNMTLGASSGGRDCKSSGTMAYRLQQLQINGCKDVDQDSMIKLMSHVYMLKILSLEETSLVDDALFGFKGCSLEEFDISETKVSMRALAFIMRNNPNVKYLKATDCKNIHQHGSNSRIPGVEASHYDLLAELARIPTMEEAALGWGFSTMAVEKLETTFGKLKAITLGLGASLDHDALCVIPGICPLLERVILTFQVVSDDTLRHLLGSLKYLQELGIICCLGALTSYSFQIGMPNLRVLRLKWVTPWMTNHDLVSLTQNCSNLVELSLSGCKLLDSDSQDIITSGWPGLMVIHLEDCGKITANGVCSLFDCKAVEDLLLRHNGQGIGRNFVVQAASQLPLLRKLALDLCDACDGGFESPSYAERFYLSHVRISCCKSQRCGFEFGEKKFFKPVHKETIVLEWNRKELRTTVVKERI